MGLSSKQVSSDRHGWNQALLQSNTLELPKSPSLKRQASQIQQEQQQQQTQVEALKCPRCDSTNTKFCYYNNYNKSQPRHFCKACKRHWTKGGTLRNVPVDGGRKNKRLKTSNSSTKTASKNHKTNMTTTNNTTTKNTNDNIKLLLQNQQHQSKFSLPLGASSLVGFEQKNFSDAFYQTLLRQPPCSLPEPSITFNKGLNDGVFLGSSLSVPQNSNDQDHLQFPYSNLGSFESNSCSISSSNLYNYTGDQANGLEETVINSLNNTSSSSISDHHQPWTTSNCGIDMSNNWGWDDFDKFVSVEADLSMPWDETDIKLPEP